MNAKIASFLKNALILGLIITAALAVYYSANVASVYLYQRSYIFRPVALGKDTPADFGAPFVEIRFKSGELDLMGWWLSHGPNRPVLLYCHGNAASLSLLAEVSRLLYDYGWNVFMFDYRGYGKSELGGTTIKEETIFKDTEAAYQWARAQAKGEPVVVWGHSLGSALAARLAASHKVNGVVLEGAFSSMYDLAKHKFWDLPIFEFMIWDPFQTDKHVQNRHGAPVLFIHGEKDSVIPIDFGRKTFEAASQPKEFIAIPGMEHNEFPSYEKQYHQQIAEVVRSWGVDVR